MNIRENKEKIIEYLFGKLADNERDDFEDRLFNDEELSLFLDDVETDLVDEYVRGELDFEVKRRFEKNYLTTESRRIRLDQARILDARVFNQKPFVISSESERSGLRKLIAGLFRKPNPIYAGGMAAIVLLILFGGLWIFVRQNNNPMVAADNSNILKNSPIIDQTPVPETSPVKAAPRNKDSIDPTDANRNSSNENIRPAPSPRLKNAEIMPKLTPEAVRQKTRVFAFSLLPPVRSSTVPVLELPAEALTVRLQLFDNFSGEYKKFTLELSDSAGNPISIREISNNSGRTRRSLSVSFPYNQLTNGNYELAVRGTTSAGSVEEINFFNFVVVRK